MNSGTEFSFRSFNIDTEDFTWTTTFNVSTIKNEITKLRQKGGLVVCKPVLGFENRLISFIFMDSLPFKLIEIFSMPKQNNSI